MIERNKIEDLDDVPVTLTLRRLRFILSKVDAARAQASEEEAAFSKDRATWVKEYARTGKIAEFDEEAADAGLIGHKSDCTVWDSSESLFSSSKCNCGLWGGGA